jgi:hypothetical protein
MAIRWLAEQRVLSSVSPQQSFSPLHSHDQALLECSLR